MTEIVLRDIDSTLAARIRRVAEARNWDLPRTLQHLLEQGLFAVEAEMNVRLTDTDSDVLRKAIAALEQIPSDPGFSLIGRVERPTERCADNGSDHRHSRLRPEKRGLSSAEIVAHGALGAGRSRSHGPDSEGVLRAPDHQTVSLTESSCWTGKGKCLTLFP